MLRRTLFSRLNIILIIFKINLFLVYPSLIHSQNSLRIGLEKTKEYLSQINNKKVGLVSNHTSKFFLKNKSIHFVDSLIKHGVEIDKIFAPEHGFRGELDAGEKITNSIDSKTGIELISLYGKKRKPSESDLSNIDIMIFDIQDVGARFYTYLSTLHYVMESCAENNIKLLVLDRPNPNGHYIDGPVMEKESMSFVGLHPVPIVYGMTIGEYAKMINGEGWLKNGIKCDLEVIRMDNYYRDMKYELKEKPSPNLPNSKSINLYPSLCFFEQTPISVGRGTNLQFQTIGLPTWKKTNFSFTPKSMPGAKTPKHQNKKCYGFNLTTENHLSKVSLEWLILSYEKSENKDDFFRAYFFRLAGNKTLEKQIKSRMSEKEIRKTWVPGLNEFKKIRKKYLIY
tara:strand:+ start:1158 stop:2348 length:1191 start_codon:yes stop_codon:yes gene_type:complete